LCDHLKMLVRGVRQCKRARCSIKSARHTGLDLAVESAFEEKRKVHLEAESVLDHVGIDQDLVGDAEVEGKLILVHELAVLL